MRIAIVHDAIFCRAGGERVFLNFIKAFPQADLYTASYDPDNAYDDFKNYKIRVTWFDKIARKEKYFKKLFFPFGILAMNMLDLRRYDLIITTGTHCGKYARFSPKAIVINYCFTPFRLAWDPSSYAMYENSTGILRFLMNAVVAVLKGIDYRHSKKVTHFMAMTPEMEERIKLAYKPKRPIPIVLPSINIGKYGVNKLSTNDYYLAVSRLEKYKKIDVVINAFNQNVKKLIVVGRGKDKRLLTELATGNIIFLEGLSDKEVADLYANCKAFIFPQHEDYGLTPIEANACGKPVIAYNKGGILYTQVPYVADNGQWTCLFFDQQVPESLNAAIEKFESISPSDDFIRNHAEQFDDQVFISKAKSAVNQIVDSMITQ